jgi:hypothetical protein
MRHFDRDKSMAYFVHNPWTNRLGLVTAAKPASGDGGQKEFTGTIYKQAVNIKPITPVSAAS